MIGIFREDEKYSIMRETGNSTRLLACISKNYLSEPMIQEYYEWSCNIAFSIYSEVVFADADGISWVRDNALGDSYIETDEVFISICFKKNRIRQR